MSELVSWSVLAVMFVGEVARFIRARRAFDSGYRMALDHAESAVRIEYLFGALPTKKAMLAAIRKLRAETGA